MKAKRVVAARAVAFVAGLALLTGTAPLLANAAGAQTAADKNKVDQQITAAQQQVDTASAEEQKLLSQIDESTARKKALDAKVASFDTQIAGVQRQLDTAQSKLSALETQQRAVEGRLTDARASLDAAKQDLARQAIAAYTGQSEAANYAAMLLGAASVGDLASKRSYIRAVVGSQSETIATTEHLRDEISDLSKQVEASKNEAAGQRDLVASQKASLQTSRDAQAAARAQVQTEINQTDQLKAQVVARKDEFEAQVEDLQAQSNAIAETLRQRAAAAAAAATSTTVAGRSGGSGSQAATAPAKAPGRLLVPVPGAPITSPFGYRIHPIYGTRILHTGIDYGADTGTPIRAAADGVVVSAGWIDGYGNATIIDVGGGIAVLYGHQSAFRVTAGQKVTQGQTVGLVGCTGNCTGPHVHFEVRVNGDPVDPTGYI
ncbi:MAG TPA: peptidoglycan DD-metalloendopeptidase family protein [Acidimicrobiales bacterium]|nr:peptidoglycan DD-metalloendopeptidase family protein [Acidimicrobiales bacterium]